MSVFPGLTEQYDADYVMTLLSDMESLGYYFDELSSYDGYLCFRTDIACGLPTSFATWCDVDNWLQNVC